MEYRQLRPRLHIKTGELVVTGVELTCPILLGTAISHTPVSSNVGPEPSACLMVLADCSALMSVPLVHAMR